MLYKVVIQKLVIGKSHPTEKQLAANRRVVVVEGATVNKGAAHLRRLLEMEGAFKDTAGSIVSVSPVPSGYVVLAS
jgi:hypothetical protein